MATGLAAATSALDSQSERLVQQAIEQFERQHTVLVIAHRLSTIVTADQICVLDQGRIVERATMASCSSVVGSRRGCGGSRPAMVPQVSKRP